MNATDVNVKSMCPEFLWKASLILAGIIVGIIVVRFCTGTYYSGTDKEKFEACQHGALIEWR